MRLAAAIVLATLIATPALAIDIVSGSGEVIKNGAGLNVVNGDPCDGRMEAACLDREGDRGRGGFPEPLAPAAEPEPEREYDYDYKDQVSVKVE